MEPKPQQQRKKIKKGKTVSIHEFLEQQKNVHSNMNLFKEAEKFYKEYDGVLSDFSDVYDFDAPDFEKRFSSGVERIQRDDGLEMYRFKFPQGVYLIRRALTVEQQLEVAQRCMNEYVKAPYRTNLFVFEKNVSEQWKVLQNTYNQQEISVSSVNAKNVVADPDKYYFNRAIRWANVGSQYDWNSRQYPEVPTPMPPLIKMLQERAIEVTRDCVPETQNYEAQSVIINFYKPKDYMTGHLDDAEKDQDSPIYSFSFGLSCIFLIGDTDKNAHRPVAIKLNSGDLLVMSGYSRRCWHGVPRIMRDTLDAAPYQEYARAQEQATGQQPPQDPNGADSAPTEPVNTLKHVINYLAENRINLNFRQIKKSSD